MFAEGTITLHLVNYCRNSIAVLINYEGQDEEFRLKHGWIWNTVESETLKDILTDISSYYPVNIGIIKGLYLFQSGCKYFLSCLKIYKYTYALICLWGLNSQYCCNWEKLRLRNTFKVVHSWYHTCFLAEVYNIEKRRHSINPRVWFSQIDPPRIRS